MTTTATPLLGASSTSSSWEAVDWRTIRKEVLRLQMRTEKLIRQLNRKIMGWANYCRHVVAKQTFSYVDRHVFRALMTWIDRKHPNKSAYWKRQRYFRSEGRGRATVPRLLDQ